MATALACLAAPAQQSMQSPHPTEPAMAAKAQRLQSRPMAQEEIKDSSALQTIETDLRAELAQHPDSPDLLYHLALVLQKENKPRESLQIYTRAASLQKPTAEQLRSVALDYVLLNDYDDAIHWLRIALSFNPNNVDVLYSLGRCFYTQNQFAKAEEAFVRTLQLKPDNYKAEENLGLTYDAENRPKLAEQALRTAAGWAERNAVPDPWPYLDLGGFLLNQSRAAEALPYLQRAVELGPQMVISHSKLGLTLVNTGKPADGAKELEIAARLDPKNPKIHFELGRAYRETGELEKSRAEFALSKTLYSSHSLE